jgi:hypothetical protein
LQTYNCNENSSSGNIEEKHSSKNSAVSLAIN